MFYWQLAALLFWGSDAPPTGPRETLIEEHLELAFEDKVYLQLEREKAKVLIRGLEVHLLEFQAHEGFPSAPSPSSRVTHLIPGLPEKLVVACSGCDDPSRTTSLEDRIGIDEMPANFVAVLSDGTSWLVVSEQGWGPAGLLKTNYWRARAALPYLRSLMSEGEGQLLISRMQPGAARHLYWTLQPGMGILRADASFHAPSGRKEFTMDAEHVFILVFVALAFGCIWVLHRMGETHNK